MNRKQRAYQQFVNNPKVSSDEEFQKQLQDIVKSYSTEITPVYTTKQDISKERKQIRQTQQKPQPFLVPEGWGALTINEESANPVKRYQDSKKRSENAKDTKWVTPDQNVIKNYKLDKVLKKNPESEYAKLTDPRYVKSLMVNNDSQMYGQLQIYDPKHDAVSTYLPDGSFEKRQSFSEWSNQRLKEQGQLEDKFVQSMGDVNYFQSAYNTFQQNRNMAERDYFAGNILRTNEMLSYANDAEQYLNNQSKINEYSNIMDAADLYQKGQNKEALLPYLRKHGLISLNGSINPKKLQLIFDEYNGLRKQNEKLYNNYKILQSYEPTKPGMIAQSLDKYIFHPIDRAIQSAERAIGMGEKSTWITDDVEGTRFHLEGIGNPNTTPQQKLQMIRKFKNSIAERQAYWQKGYKENNADAKKYEKGISDRYKYEDQKSQDEGIFSLHKLKYGTWGVLGSSMSSYEKTIPSLILSFAGAATGKLAISAGTALLSGAIDMSQGYDENSGQIVGDYKALLEKNLNHKGLSNKFMKEGKEFAKANGIKLTPGKEKEELYDLLVSGQWKLKDKDLVSVSYESARGINSDFYDDMMATAGDTYVGIAVNAIPFGKIADLGKFTKISSRFKAGLRKAIGSDNYHAIQYALDIAKLNTVGAKKGFEVGMGAAGPVGGVVGLAAEKTGLYSAGKFVGKNLAPGMIVGGVIGSQFDDDDSQLGATVGVATGALLGGLFGATGGKVYMANKLGQLAEKATTFGQTLPPSILKMTGKINADVIKQNSKELIGRLALRDFSERVEEGKQQLHSEQFINGYYQNHPEYRGFIDRLMNDFLVGSKASYATIGSYMNLDLLGDRELMQNINSVILGGGGHDVATNIFGSAYRTSRQITANNVIARNLYLDKIGTRDLYRTGFQYAKRALRGPNRSAEALEAFDKMIEYSNEQSKKLDQLQTRYSSMTQAQQQSEEGLQLAQQIQQAKQFLDPELIQDAKKYYSRVSRLANSRLIQDAAKRQGIETKDSWKNKKQNDKFAKFVSRVAMYDQLSEDNKKENIDPLVNAINDLMQQREMRVIMSQFDSSDFTYDGSIDQQIGIDLAQNRNLVTESRRRQQDQEDDKVQARRDLLKAKRQALAQLYSDIEKSEKNFNNRNDIGFVKAVIGELIGEVEDQAEKEAGENQSIIDEYKESFSDNKNHTGFTDQEYNDLKDKFRQMALFTVDQVNYDKMLDNLLGTSHLKDEDTLKKQIQEYEENKRKKHFWQKQQESPDLFEYDSLGKFKDILDKTNKFYESRKDQIEDVDRSIEDDRKLQDEIELDFQRRLVNDTEEAKEVEDAERNEQIDALAAARAGLEEELGISDEKQNKDNNNSKEPATPITEETPTPSPVQDKEGNTEQQPKDDTDNNQKQPKDNTSQSQPEDTEPQAPEPESSKPQPKFEQSEASKQVGGKLNSYKVWCDKHVKRNLTTSSHYFIMDDDGKLQLARRVHSTLDSRESDTNANLISRNKQIQDFIENLNKITTLDQLTEYVNSVDQTKNIQGYIDYLKQGEFKDYFDDEVKFGIAHELVNKGIGTPGDVGNLIDFICRSFFAGDQLSYGTNLQIFDGEVSSIREFMNGDTFNSIISQLKSIQEYYNSLGWTLYTQPYTWHTSRFDSKTGKRVNIAGETDMIAVDQDGGIHIIDFKTSKKSFTRKSSGKTDLEKIDPGYRTSWIGFYSEQQTMYKLMMQDNSLEFNIKSVELLPFSVKYKKDGDSFILNKVTNEPKNKSIQIDFSDDVENRFTKEINIDEFKQAYDAARNLMLSTHKEIAAELDTIDNLPQSYREDLDRIFKESPDAITEFDNTQETLTKLQAHTSYMHDAINRMKQILENAEEYERQEAEKAEELAKAEQRRKAEERRNNPNPEDYDIKQQIYADIDRTLEAISDIVSYDPNGDPQDLTPDKQAELSKLMSELYEIAVQLGDLSILPEDIEKQNDIFKQVQTIEDDFGITSDQHNVVKKYSKAKMNPFNNLDQKQIDEDEDLVKLSTESDFVTNSTFTYKIGEYTDKLGEKKKTIFVDIEYNGKSGKKSFKDMRVWVASYSQDGKRLAKTLYDQITQLQDKLQQGYRLVPERVNRTNGKTKTLRSKQQKNILDTDISKTLGTDLYKIKFDGKQDTIGIVKKDSTSTESILTVCAPNTEGDLTRKIQSYPINQALHQGDFVVLYRPQYDELSGFEERDPVPIIMRTKQISQNDADLITDILSQIAHEEISPAQYYYKGDKNTGLSYGQILSLFFPFGENLPNHGKNLMSVYIDKDNPAKVMISIKEKDPKTGLKQLKQHYYSYDFSDDEQIKQFNKDIQKYKIAARANFSQQNLAENDELYDLKEFFENNPNEVLQFGDSIKFEASDFKNPKQPNQSLGGIAWYIKNNILTTDFNGFESSKISFDGVKVEKIEKESTEDETPIDESMEIEGTTNEDENDGGLDQYFRDDQEVDYVAWNRTQSHRNFEYDAERAAREIHRLLGSVRVDFAKNSKGEDDFVAMLRGGVGVVGRCYADSIILSKFADEGTEYHEAFHRMAEVLIPKRLHDKLYKEFRESHSNTIFTDKQVGEELAEGFRIFMLNKPRLHWSLNLVKMYNNIKDYIQQVSNMNMGWKLYTAYMIANSGIFRYVKASNKRKEEFKNVFKFKNAQSSLFKRGGRSFKYVLNQQMYDELVDTLVYAVLNNQNFDWGGSDIQNIRVELGYITGDAISDEKRKKQAQALYNIIAAPQATVEQLESKLGESKYKQKAVGLLAMKELLQKDVYNKVVMDDVAAKLSSIATNATKIAEEDNVVDIEGDPDTDNGNIGEHTRASYEFSRFSKASQRVKFFFSTFSNFRWDTRFKVDENNHVTFQRVLVAEKNSLGMPKFMDAGIAFNRVMNQLHDISTIQDLYEKVSSRANDNPMFKQFKKRLDVLIEQAKTDPDKEALLTQIKMIIKSNKNTFMICKANRNPQSGKYSLSIQSSDSDYSSIYHKQKWSQMFSNGGGMSILHKNDKGETVLKDGHNARELYDIKNFFTAPMGERGQVKINGKLVKVYGLLEHLEDPDHRPFTIKNAWRRKDSNDPTDLIVDCRNEGDFVAIKQDFCNQLQKLGINFTLSELDYMLEQKYGSSDANAMKELFESSVEWIDSKDGEKKKAGLFESFYSTLDSLIKPVSGRVTLNINQQYIDRIWDNVTLTKELSRWKYNYEHSQEELSVLAINNNKYYQISDNNYISDMVDNLNDVQYHEGSSKDGYIMDQSVRNLIEYSYNYIESDESTPDQKVGIGSIIAKQMIQKNHPNISVRTLIGFKTNQGQDKGRDYFKITKREDYVAKMTILQKGYIVFPTMSDKKTWVFLDGIKLPGINYKEGAAKKNLPIISATMVDGKEQINIRFPNNVLDQFREYAMCEYKAIKEAIDMDLKPEEVIANFDNKDQGKYFSSLTGVYDKDGNFISFVDKEAGYEKSLKIAEETFFDPTKVSRDQQRDMINELLVRQTQKEIEYMKKLHLVSQNKLGQYINKGLDTITIGNIKSAIKTGRQNNAITGNSDAIWCLAADITAKSIMSLQEVERIFSGNPAYYKWQFSGASLVDRQVDEFKRFGGLISTGDNNVLDFINSKDGEYTCAEVANELVSSPQYNKLKQLMTEGEYKSALINLAQDGQVQFTPDQIDAMTLDEVKQHIPEDVKDIVETKISAETKSYENGIDVADGGAYITANMCENLLRMNGKWSKDIERAFKILKSSTKEHLTPKEMLSIAENYQKVFTSVIGCYKYTAFGLRRQDVKSKTKPQTITRLVPYYNKMALFPIFDCIATGRMADIYQKMKAQNIDMLMINSAVKVGSQGSLGGKETENKIDFASDNIKFNTYKQKYQFLRKQLNTDPGDKDLQNMGTQMTKIALSNIVLGRTYTVKNNDGSFTTKTGLQLRDDIMSAINDLSKLGYDSLQKEFFDKDDDGNIKLNEERFAKYLRKQLTDRDADNNSVGALNIVYTNYDDEGNPIKGTEQMEIPLAATSNSNWIESILTSSINKRVIDIATPGAPFIQRSVWGMEGMPTKLLDNQVPGIFNGTLNHGNRLQMINEEGSMDCMLSLDYFVEYYEDENGEEVMYFRPAGKKCKLQVFDKETKKYRNMSFTEARKWLIDNKVISSSFDYTDKDGNKVHKDGASANIIGYRIPTQAQSSIHALRCVDVLPVVRDTVVLPEEFTKITGSDFDIDKLFLSCKPYNSYKDKDDHNKRKVNFDFKEGSEQDLQAKLMDGYMSLLLDWKSEDDKDSRTCNILHRSIDNDTSLVKAKGASYLGFNVLSDIEQNLDKEQIVMPYDFYTPRNQVETKDTFLTGKTGIGPFALNNNSQILTMLYDVKFTQKVGTIMKDLGLDRLGRTLDRNQQNILSWLSAMINAHVDIAKDPYITRLNVNPYTYNLVNLLLRVGLGEDTFYFTTQGIMKDLAFAYNDSVSTYMADDSKTPWQRRRDAENDVLKKYFSEEPESDNDPNCIPSIMEEIQKGFDDIPTAVEQDYIIRQILGEFQKDGKWVRGYIDAEGNEHLVDVKNKVRNSIIREMSINQNPNKKGYINPTSTKKMFTVMSRDGKEIKLSPLDVTRWIFIANKRFEKPGDALANLVKYSKIDTKKQGKNIAEQDAYLKGYNDTYNPGGQTYQQFEPTSLSALKDGSYIGKKTKYATDLYRDVVGQQLLSSCMAVFGTRNKEGKRMKDGILPQILKAINRKDGAVPADLLNKIMIQITSCIKSEFFNDYCNGNNKDGDIINIHDLFSGDNTIYDRLLDLQIKAESDPNYSYLKNNLLLKVLVPTLNTEDGPNKIEYNQIELLNTFGEREGTYEKPKFVKFFNSMDDDSKNSNYVYEAWERLLEDTDETVRKFARDLVIYSFYSSGDMSGFSKFFKYVPNSWRLNSGYVDFVRTKLKDLNTRIPSSVYIQNMVDDIILNNWFDNDFVKEYRPSQLIGIVGQNTITYNPHAKPENMISLYADYKSYQKKVLTNNSGEAINMLGVLSPFDHAAPNIACGLAVRNGKYQSTIDYKHPPRFIKVSRNNMKKGQSQHDYTIYMHYATGEKRIQNSNGEYEAIRYPIYVKVNPKGYKNGIYNITEFGTPNSVDNVFGIQSRDAAQKSWKDIEPTAFDQEINKVKIEQGKPTISRVSDVENIDRILIGTENGKILPPLGSEYYRISDDQGEREWSSSVPNMYNYGEGDENGSLLEDLFNFKDSQLNKKDTKGKTLAQLDDELGC